MTEKKNNCRIMSGGNVLFTIEDYDQAIARYTKEARDNCNSEALFNRGKCFFKTHRYVNAFKDFNNFVTNNPTHKESVFYRGKCYAVLQYKEQAKIDFEMVLQLDSRHVDANIFLQELEELEEAEVNSNASEMADSLKEQGNNQYKENNFIGAYHSYTQGITLNPTVSKLHCNRGLAAFSLECFPLAEIDFTKALQIEPKYVKAYYLRGLTRKKLNECTLAELDFCHVLCLDPKNGEAKTQLRILKGIQNTNRFEENDSHVAFCNKLNEMFGSEELKCIRLFFNQVSEKISSIITDGNIHVNFKFSKESNFLISEKKLFFIFILKYCVVNDNLQHNSDSEISVLERSDICMDTCTLEIHDKNAKKATPEFIYEMNDKCYLWSCVFQQKYIQIECQKIRDSIHNFNYAVECCCAVKLPWPQEAKNWIDRKREFNWPSFSTVETVVQQGCLLFPADISMFNPKGIHWKLSFKLGIRILFETFTKTQTLIYKILKTSIKSRTDCINQNSISTLILKTTMLWLLEETPNEMFIDENIQFCIELYLHKLFNFLKEKRIPNYFIPDINLWKNVQYNGLVSEVIFCMLHEGISFVLTIPFFFNEIGFLSGFCVEEITVEDEYHSCLEGSLMTISSCFKRQNSIKEEIIVKVIEELFQVGEVLPAYLQNRILYRILRQLLLVCSQKLEMEVKCKGRNDRRIYQLRRLLKRYCRRFSRIQF